MSRNLRWIAVLIVLVSMTFALAACDLDSEEQQALEAVASTALPPTPTNTDTPLPPPTESPIRAPTDTPLSPPTGTALPPPTEAPAAEPTESSDSSQAVPTEPTATPDADPSDGDVTAPIFNPDTLAQAGDLDFFHSRTDVIWEGLDASGADVSGSMFYEVDQIRNPLLQRIELGGEHPFLKDLDLLGGQGLEMFRIEGDIYFQYGGQENRILAEESGFDAEAMAFFASDGLLVELNGPTYEGQRVIDGLNVDYWTFNETQLTPAGSEEGQIEEATGFLAISKDRGWIVEAGVEISGTGIDLPSGNTLQSGTLATSIRFSDIDIPPFIGWPEWVQEETQTDDELPVPPGAEEVDRVANVIMFRSKALPPQIADFYLTTLFENGWTLFRETPGNPYRLTFKKDGGEVRVIIRDQPDLEKTKVIIFKYD